MELTPEQQGQLFLALAGLIVAIFAVLLVYARKLARDLLTKTAEATGLPEILAQADNLDRVVTTSILYVREQVLKLAKGLIVDGPRTAPEKLALAERTARSLAPGPMREVSSEHFAVLAEAKLQSVRPLLVDPVGVAAKSLPPLSSINPGAAALGTLGKLPSHIPKHPPVPTFARDDDPPTSPGRKK